MKRRIGGAFGEACRALQSINKSWKKVRVRAVLPRMG